MLDGWLDLASSFRSLRRRPGFVAVVVATLGLAIGVAVAFFGVVDVLVLDPLPYPDPERLVMLRTATPASPMIPMSPRHFDVLRREPLSLEAVAALDWVQFHLRTDGGAERLDGALVSTGFFAMLGVEPVLGRDFRDDETTASAAGTHPALLSHALWQSRFGGDPGVLGRDLEMLWTASFGPDRRLGTRFTVVGVLPADLVPPMGSPEVWVPLALEPAAQSGVFPYLFPFGRLAPGASAEAAADELGAAIRTSEGERSPDRADLGVTVVPLVDRQLAPVRDGLRMTAFAIVLVLVLAAANVSLLLLARGIERRPELETRAALGASRLRLLRLLLLDALLLGLGSAVPAVVVAGLAIAGLKRFGTGILPRAADLALDARAVLSSLALSLLVAGAVAALPALRWGRPAFAASRVTRRSRGSLVVLEVALATVLVGSSALLWRSFEHLRTTDLGVDPAVISLQLTLPHQSYPDRERRADFHRRALAALGALPGTEAVAAISALPLTMINTASGVELEGLPRQEAPLRSTAFRRVLAGPAAGSTYRRTAGQELLQGRDLTADDEVGAPRTVLVNEAFRRQIAGTADFEILGKRLALLDLDLEGLEVVGVVSNVLQAGPARDPRPTVYVPGLDAPAVGFVVRSSRAVEALAPEIRAALAALDPALPVHSIQTFDDLALPWVARPRLQGWLIASLATLGLGLAVVGVFGMLSHAVAQRRREIGVRVALGAAPDRIFRWLLAAGLAPVLAGILVGGGLVALSSRLLAGLLFGVETTDPSIWLLTVAIFLTSGTIAATIPAGRARRLEATEALREG